MFANHGYAKTDIQVLANSLDIGKGTIYRHFPSKESVFLATVDREMHLLSDCLREVNRSGLEQLELAKGLIRAYLAFFDARPWAVELFILERAVFKTRKKPTYFEYRDASMSYWQDAAEQLVRAGVLRNIGAQTIVEVIGDALYGAIFTNHFSNRKESFEARADALIDVMFVGLLSDQSRSTT